MDCATMDETVALIIKRIVAGQFTQHVGVNVAKLVHMQSDSQLAKSVRECDVISIDGMGVVWGARMLGHDVAERVTGVDLFDKLLAEAATLALPVYFLGATEAVVARVATVSVERFPGLRIAGYHHGYFGKDEQPVVDLIRESGARLLFVAITSPMKEESSGALRTAMLVFFLRNLL